MPLVLDTNVYLFAMRSSAGASFFERRFLPLIFRTYLAGVVAEELYAGALDAAAVHLVDRQVGSLKRVGRIVTPTFDDWQEAGQLVARITRREPGRKAKMQETVNDVLLALSARRIGADLYTFNRSDFELIRRYTPFSLIVLRDDRA